MHIVILGNGITGTTAARFARKHSSEARITVISAESDYFYARTALMYIYMGHLTFEDTKPYENWFWEKNRIHLLRDYVTNIDTAQQELHFQQHEPLPYDKLVLATGSNSNFLNWPGINLKGVQGLYSIQDLENMEAYTQDARQAVIVGGGLIGIELAEMLHTRGIQTTMLVRESSYWNNILPPEESAMVNREIFNHHIDLRLGTELAEIKGDEQGRAQRVITKDGQDIPCQFVGISIGVHPNLTVVSDTPIQTNKGIQVDPYLQTNIPNVYAGGDCSEQTEPKPGRGPIEAIWYTGKMMGEVLGHNVIHSDQPKEYDPGVFFNSAKFFTIDYQVYGSIKPNPEPLVTTLYWEHPGGKKAIRINYHEETRAVVGFNLMGTHYRHRVCEYWIEAGTPIEEVLTQLPVANCDPEFTPQHEDEVVAIYNQQHPDNPVTIQRKKGLFERVKALVGA